MNRNLITKLVFVLFTLLTSSTVSGQPVDRGRELIKSVCFDCHDKSSAEGELDLESMLNEKLLVKDLKHWQNVAKRIELGDMPPADTRVLTTAEKLLFKNWFASEIEDFDYESIKDPGYEPIRRLSHVEYRHAIRDLFGADLSDTHRFPKDLTGSSGFDNTANTLFLQGSLLEKYVQSAEDVCSQVFEPARAENNAARRATLEKVRNRILGWGGNRREPEARAKKILYAFASRAFRRKVNRKELDQLTAIFAQSYEKSGEFQPALQQAMTAVLIMPQFLMKVESEISESKSGEPQPITDFDLASRLSWFLWASMPDDELFGLASRGKLSDPEVLNQQIDRMLLDRRAKSLGYIFAAQWLGFEDIGVRIRLDPIDNPWCTDTLMTAMRTESSLFFYSLIRDNQPVSRLVDADYTYLNEELARHYRIRGIKGDHMRPVKLKTQRRGGILSHASILAVTAFPDRTSPVVRGQWVLDTLLGTPPPEPPDDVGELEEEDGRRNLSFREKVQRHSRDPACYSCHSEMDPIGFALENYDNFGRWRKRRYGEPIDAKGQLPDGSSFDGPVELRDVLIRTRQDDITRQLAQKMLAYALGRQLEYYDEAAIRKIVEETQNDGYRFQTLVKAVTASYPFRYRQRPRPEMIEPSNEQQNALSKEGN